MFLIYFYTLSLCAASIVETCNKFSTGMVFCGTFRQIYFSITSISNEPEDLIIPDVITYQGTQYHISEIREYAFKEKNISKVTFPSTVKKCGKGMFLKCKKLNTVDLSKTRIKILESNFFAQSSVSTVILPNSLTDIGERAFESCNVDNIKITLMVTAINEHAFANCLCLRSVEFVKSRIQRIMKNAFSNCKNLETFTGPETLSHIGPSAFVNCSSLASVLLKDSRLNVISEYLFNGCIKLTEVELPVNLNIIGRMAFYRTAIDVIDFPKSLKAIGDMAFMYCVLLNNVNFKDTQIQTIPSYCFYKCISLKKISFGSSIQAIASHAFVKTNMSLLVNFPKSLTYIGTSAFEDCISLVRVNMSGIPINSIDRKAFAGCINLRSIELPSTLAYIGERAFLLCRSLSNVSYCGNASIVFMNTRLRNDVVIYVTENYPAEYLLGNLVVKSPECNHFSNSIDNIELIPGKINDPELITNAPCDIQKIQESIKNKEKIHKNNIITINTDFATEVDILHISSMTTTVQKNYIENYEKVNSNTTFRTLCCASIIITITFAIVRKIISQTNKDQEFQPFLYTQGSE